MKINALIVGLILLSLGRPLQLLSAQSAPPEAALRDAAKTLTVSGLDPVGLDTVLSYARTPDSDPYFKSRAMAAYALAMLAKGDTNLFERARLAHLSSFPGDQKLIPLKFSDCVKTCSACGGAGSSEEQVTCRVCQNTGRCLICKGTGKWQGLTTFDSRSGQTRQNTLVACHKCKGSGICPTCNGQRIRRTPCAACGGQGAFLQIPQEKVSAAFTAILGEIILAVDREAAWVQRIAQAQAEPDITKRMAACQALLKELQDRPEREAITTLFAADKLSLQQRAEQETAARLASEKEIATLRRLKDSPAPSAAIITLQEYLEKNPDSPHRLEAKIILDGLLAGIENARKKERLWYLIGGALFVLAALSCLHISFFKYNLYSHSKVVPHSARSTKPESAHFTDPLSLNAQESRARSSQNPPTE